jgi:uncharacterized protein (TIGR04222 family)
MASMLTMRGPQFLLLFAVLAVVVYVLVGRIIAARERERQPSSQRLRDPYAIAYLRGSINELIKVAALSLTMRGLLRVGTTTLETVDRSDVERVGVPIERAVLKSCVNGANPDRIRAHPNVATAAEEYLRDLTDRGLLADAEIRGMRRGVVLLGILVLVGLAVAKIVVALSTGHSNIAFLVIGAVVATIVLLTRISRRRTQAGDAALSDLTSLFSALRGRPQPLPLNAVPEATLLAAVYGVYLLPDARAWNRVFTRADTSSSNGGSSCGSGSSCGGGGGCGGGGCGGCGS